MQNLLLDVSIVVGLCVPRAGTEATGTALALAEAEGVRTWVYAGSVQALEYFTVSELRAALAEQGPSRTSADLHARARELLQANTAPHL